MRTILFILQKEFIQVFRNKIMLPVIFVIPLVQLIILVNAATLEMKSIRLAIVDKDLSETSRKFVSKFNGSPFYIVDYYSFSIDDAEKELKKGNIDAIIHIPSGFEKKLLRESNSKIQIIVNAINGVVAGITNAYIQGITTGYNTEVITNIVGKSTISASLQSISITNSYWYNPELNYKNFMVPAVLVLLVTIIGMFLTGLNLVREKELGTIEQINVTPIKKYQFIAGKLIPFWILALLELSVGLALGKLLFNIPIVGNIGLLFLFAGIYLLVILGIGLLVSTTANTQQQAMFVMFFIMIVCIMLSGIFTSVETMPKFAQILNRINPIYYFMRVVRMILLKGSQFTDLLTEFFSLCIFAYLMLQFAVLRYKKKTA
jgi:ABC-2 type transport system permease protein